MSMTDTGLAGRVLRAYPITASRVKQIHAAESKAVWTVTAGNERYGLKRLNYGKDRMLFAIQAQQHIAARGGPVAPLVRTRDGRIYAERDGGVFVLYGWTEGRGPDFASSSDLRRAVRLLARFHQASEGYRPAEPCRESSKLGKWPAQYAAMEAHLREWEVSRAHRELSAFLTPYWKPLLRQAQRARELLADSSYGRLSASGIRMLCHQDYSEGNLLLHGTQDGTILDLDSVTYDFPARDLRKLLLKRMQARGRWDDELFDGLLRTYQETFALNEEQQRLVLIDLTFPHLFHETAKNPYRNGQSVPRAKLLAALRIELERGALWERRLAR